jgi:hypothetical protein
MLKLTKSEITMVAGGDCDAGGCYCQDYDGQLTRNDGFGADTTLELCGGACCIKVPTIFYPVVSGSMPLNAGWYYNGTDPGINIIEEPFQIVYKPREGKC